MAVEKESPNQEKIGSLEDEVDSVQVQPADFRHLGQAVANLMERHRLAMAKLTLGPQRRSGPHHNTFDQAQKVSGMWRRSRNAPR
jgi:hypothetical protein